MKLPFLPRIRIKRLILLVLFLALVAGGFAVYWWWTDGLAYGNDAPARQMTERYLAQIRQGETCKTYVFAHNSEVIYAGVSYREKKHEHPSGFCDVWKFYYQDGAVTRHEQPNSDGGESYARSLAKLLPPRVRDERSSMKFCRELNPLLNQQ